VKAGGGGDGPSRVKQRAQPHVAGTTVIAYIIAQRGIDIADPAHLVFQGPSNILNAA
jgi:hypothetical protein